MAPSCRFAIALVTAGMLALAGCERTVGPRRLRISDLEAPKGFATFTGRVRGLDDPSRPERCGRDAAPVAGVRVDLGLWDGSPASYRDTTTRTPPSKLDEPRFIFLASTVTDQEGKFVFRDVPRHLGYAMRAVPAQRSRWRHAYGATMYGLASVSELPDFPTICILPR